MVKSLKLHVFYKVAVNSELANTEWLLWEETQGKFLRVSGPNILVNWSVHSHVLCALLLKDTLFNMYCWSINIELTVNSTITHAKWSFSSVQSLSHVWLQPHGKQHSRLPCPSAAPGVCSNSCPSTRWCHPTILSSVVLFSSCLQSFPAVGSFQMS